MDESPRSIKRIAPPLDENLDCKAQYINMELAFQKISNGWEDSPKMRRGMQISLESPEEFEFAMSNLAAKDDLYEPAMEVAPADELFFRGQLLPLQHDPRLQLVHTLSGMRRGEHLEDFSDYKSAVEEMSMNRACAEVFAFAAPADEEGFPLHPGFQEGVPMRSVNEKGLCVQDGTNNTRSYRSDGGLDAFKNDSRSSSFRSQQSSYWGSGEKDSRDSSSSSRCSNGSSQDGCFHGAERRTQQHNKAMANNRVNNPGANANNDKVQEHHAQYSKPPLPSSKVKKWSWKALFTGLRKASKIWVDDRGEEHGHNASQRDFNRQRKPGLGSVPTGQASRGIEKDEFEGQNYVGCGDMKTARHQQASSSSKGKGLGYDEYGGHISSKYYMGSGGYRGYSYYEGSNGGRPGKEKPRLGIIAWNARETWQRWVKRPLSGKLTHTHKHSMHLTEDIHNGFNMKAKSLSSTPLTKSPVRRADNVANTPDVYGAPSSKYIGIGYAASCPASMRSSPHHSGVLAVVNKSPPASSLHDLHAAIQGAIAHCKQSQSVNPP